MPLPVFDLHERHGVALTVIVGQRRSGKTALVKRLLNEGASMDGVLVDHTNAGAGRLRAFVDERNEAVRRERDAYVARGGDADYWEIPQHLRRRLVVDNLTSLMLKQPGFCDALENLCVNHRFYAIDVVLVVQNLRILPPVVRSQVDYLAVTSTANDERCVKRIHELYVGYGEGYLNAEAFAEAYGPGLWVDNTTWDRSSAVCRLRGETLRSAL